MTISLKVLKKYKKANVFIETGTHTGNTVEIARVLGFKKIYTIELSDHFYKNAKKKFSKYRFIECIHGDSSVEIKEVLKYLDEKAVFWLDGHWSMGDTACGDKSVPLYEELTALADHDINDHIILIDDIRLLGDKSEAVDGWHNMSLDKIKELILEINPEYKFRTEDGHIPNDILVAEV